MQEFDPNQVSFADGAVRVERVVAHHRLDTIGAIVTSKGKGAEAVLRDLGVSNVSKGFTKGQLPFVFTQAQFFVSHAEPNAKVAEHAHTEGDALRIITHGSITHDGVELKAGDWMFIPKGVKYAIEIGREGASMCYCYECCCAGRRDMQKWLVDPAPDRAVHG